MGKITAVEKLLREFLGLPQRKEGTAVTRKVSPQPTDFRVDPTTIYARSLLAKLGLDLDVPAFAQLGDAWLEIGMNEKAIEAYDQALALDGSLFAVRFNRGLANTRLGRFEDALEDFGRAAGIDPEHAASFSNAAAVLAKLSRHEEGLEYAERAVHLEPANPAALVNLGAILTGLDRAEEGLRALDRALAAGPGTAKGWFDRACALAKLGRNDEAKTSLAKACELDASMKERIERDPELLNLRAEGEFTGMEQ